MLLAVSTALLGILAFVSSLFWFLAQNVTVLIYLKCIMLFTGAAGKKAGKKKINENVCMLPAKHQTKPNNVSEMLVDI